jgi:hypothetical protein
MFVFVGQLSFMAVHPWDLRAGRGGLGVGVLSMDSQSALSS